VVASLRPSFERGVFIRCAQGAQTEGCFGTQYGGTALTRKYCPQSFTHQQVSWPAGGCQQVWNACRAGRSRVDQLSRATNRFYHWEEWRCCPAKDPYNPNPVPAELPLCSRNVFEKIAPGETATWHIPITELADFKTPGIYTVRFRAEFRITIGPGGDALPYVVFSNPLRVTIAQ
jgi:hypothetical protein